MNRLNLQKRVLTVQGKHGSHRQTYYIKPGEDPAFQLKKDHTVPTTAPRSRAEVHYGLFWSGKANKGMDHALEAIGKVHDIPGNLTKIPVKVTGSLGGANGMYWFKHPSGRSEINVSKYAAWPASTLAHEYGHFLDHHLFGTGKPRLDGCGTLRNINKQGTQNNVTEAKELRGLMNAIYRSDAAKRLVKSHDDRVVDGRSTDFAKYLLMPPELFARAYAQWIGTKASPQIRQEVAMYGEHCRQYGGYHAQWTDEDFKPIHAEFDRLFAHRNLLRSHA